MIHWQDDEAIERQRFEKAVERGDIAPVNVRLAWYSEESRRDAYHVCVNCPYVARIRRRHLKIGQEDDVKLERNLCRNCRAQQKENLGVFVVLRVSK